MADRNEILGVVWILFATLMALSTLSDGVDPGDLGDVIGLVAVLLALALAGVYLFRPELTTVTPPETEPDGEDGPS